jgi:spermidine dehydrogenase
VKTTRDDRALEMDQAIARRDFLNGVSVALTGSVSYPYRPSRSPAEPILVHHVRIRRKPGLPRRNQHRAGRGELLQTTFEMFERQTRSPLARILGGGGFDPARDIQAVTVNRWPHGYADFGDPLTDPEWTSDDEKPWIIGRQRFGRIAVAIPTATTPKLRRQ